MQFSLDKSRELPFYDQIKHQLTAALHMGELKTGHRLPTVRALARALQINPKTTLKIYHRLEQEGLIEIRVGSGVRVGAADKKQFEYSYFSSLVAMVNRHLDDARRLQFSPEDYLNLLQELVDHRKRRRISCLVVECNTEQIRLFASEIASRTGVTTHPVLVTDLLSNNRRAASLLSKASFLITTDFHWDDVKRIAKQHQKVPLKIRLKPEFISTLIQCARKGGILMIVSNLDFFDNFRSALRDLGYQAVLPRIHAVLESDKDSLERWFRHVKHVYLSPLCDASLSRRIPAHIRRIGFQEQLSLESLDSLRMSMLTYLLEQASLYGPSSPQTTPVRPLSEANLP